jgi:RND family efflux transporter MFP subunit
MASGVGAMRKNLGVVIAPRIRISSGELRSDARTACVMEPARAHHLGPWAGSRGTCFGICAFFAVAALALVGSTFAQASPVTTALDCIIEPSRVVKLASSGLGVVSQVDVDRGDFVRKGQIVAKLEDAVEEANVALARERATNDSAVELQKARFNFLRNKRSRAERLRTNSYVSEASFEEAETEMRVAAQQVREAEHNLKIAELELKRSEEALKQRTIISPIDGVVVDRLLVPGEYRDEQSPLMTLAQIHPLRVEVLLPTSLLGQVRLGTKAQILPEKPLGGSYEATVTVVDRVLDSASGTFGARLELPNPEHILPAGLRCHVEFGRDPNSAVGTAQPNKRS